MTLRVRTRLTLWYSGVFFCVLCAYMAMVYGFQRYQLLGQMFRDEVRQVEAEEGLLYFAPDGTLQLHDEYYAHPQSRLLVDTLLEVHNRSGVVLYRSHPLRGLWLGDPTYADEGAGWFEKRIVRLPDGTQALMVSHLHPVGGQMLLLRLGYRLTPLDVQMRRFLALLLLAMVPAMLLAAWGGYRLSRTAFLPLDVMAARAEQITADSLHARLGIPDSGDELARMGQVINRLLERLEQSFAQMQRFTADAAHELRTPLASLRALGEHALTSGTNTGKEPLAQAVSSMLEQAERLSQTVDGLLTLARAESGASAITRSRFLLADLLDEVILLLDVLLEEKSLTLELTGRDQARYVEADRTLVRGAFLNVLHNAIRHTPPGSSIAVHCAAERNTERTMLSVCIADEGRGVPDEDRERIFERFYRSESGVAKAGSGLGLAIARLAVELNGGTIRATNGDRGGLRCTIALPEDLPGA